MSRDAAVEFAAARAVYQRRAAVDGVTLRVDRGEFVGIIGPNGAGKTTLLRLVNGLSALTNGRVSVLGMDPHGRGGHEVRKRVGYLSQTPHIDPRVPLNVREAVMAGRAGRLGFFRLPGRTDWKAVDRALELVGASALARRPVGMLSGGEFQKVGLARVLAQEPEIFLFDEPTAAIDPRAQRDLLALIEQAHAECRATSLYVTHHVRLEDGHAALPDSCQRLVMMRHGRVWRDGDRKALMDETLLRELYECCTESAPFYERAGAAG